MGQKKMECSRKVESDKERGKEITDKGNEKINEAVASKEAVSSIEIVDDDDERAVQNAISESNAIAKGIAESEIRTPGEGVRSSLKETSEQSKEYSEIESQGAAKASEMVSDYSGVGAGLSSELQQSAQEFQQIAENADQTSEDLKSQMEQQVSTLEGVF